MASHTQKCCLLVVLVLQGSLALQVCTPQYCETDDGSVYKPGKTWTDKNNPCVTYTCESMQDGSSKVLTSFVSCSKVVCSNGKAGYTLPGQCCESCNFDIGFDTLMAVGASSDAPTTSLKPTWGEWSNWTECSRTCGGGRQSRVRECLSNGRTTLNCTGSRVDVQACNTQCCPVNGGFTTWSGWSDCSVTCGNGTQYRTRSCSNPTPACGGISCVGAPVDTKSCVMTPCPDYDTSFNQAIANRASKIAPSILLPTWGEWSNWTNCSRTCNGGRQSRVRECLRDEQTTLNCVGNRIDVRDCNTQCCPVNGGFTTWSGWSDCSVTCGNGTQYRTRSCSNPAPACGGITCVGAPVDVKSCIMTPCPVDCTWFNWSDWSACNQTCNGGQHYRTRGNSPALYSGKNCTGPSMQQETCNPQPCPVDGYWKVWTEWSACSLTCGSGIQTRTRVCVLPLYGGQDCAGDSQQTRPCQLVNCPIDCQWTDWGNWTQCSVTCNGGIHTRSRQYLVTAQYGGKVCVGDTLQTSTCNSQPCPGFLVDGYWNVWTEWSACSLTCGSGIQTRTRVCVPSLYGGQDCVGDSQQTRPCQLVNCPIDCQWTDWGNWTQCSVTCNGGIHTRSRQYLVTAQYGGKVCVGNSLQTNTCNSQPCPNPCKDHGNPCYNSFVNCTPLSETQFQCGPCPIGLSGNGITCSPVNECNLTTPCFPGANCTDLLFGYSCGVCPPGYNGSGMSGPDLAYALTHWQNCSDIDECKVIAQPCNSLRQCINTVGSYLCGPCPPGYANNSRTECLLTDPCAAKQHNCENDSYCINTAVGAFRCQPLPEISDIDP